MFVVGELYLRQIGSGDPIVGVAPERECVAAKVGGAVVVTDNTDFSIPTPAFDGAPFETKRIGRRKKGVYLDREAPIRRRKGTGSDGARAGVEVIVGGGAIREDQVVEVVVLGHGTRRQSKQGHGNKATKRLKHGTSLTANLTGIGF